MEHVRLSLVTVDPDHLRDVATFVEHDMQGAIGAEPGSRGIALSCDAEIAVAWIASYWVSHDAMRESDRIESPLREKIARRGDATVSVEQFEVASARRTVRPRAGAGVR